MVWFLFTQNKIKAMSMRPKMCYYKMHENIQSAYWPDVSGVGNNKSNRKKVLCSRLVENMENLTLGFISIFGKLGLCMSMILCYILESISDYRNVLRSGLEFVCSLYFFFYPTTAVLEVGEVLPTLLCLIPVK